MQHNVSRAIKTERSFLPSADHINIYRQIILYLELRKIVIFFFLFDFTVDGQKHIYATRRADAFTIAKKLIIYFISEFGIPKCLDSNHGMYSTAKIMKRICFSLGICKQVHTPCHPQSSRLVERKNLD